MSGVAAEPVRGGLGRPEAAVDDPARPSYAAGRSKVPVRALVTLRIPRGRLPRCAPPGHRRFLRGLDTMAFDDIVAADAELREDR
jgi:hypothetical protein